MDEVNVLSHLLNAAPDGVILLLLWWEVRRLTGQVTRLLDRQDEVLAHVRAAKS